MEFDGIHGNRRVKKHLMQLKCVMLNFDCKCQHTCCLLHQDKVYCKLWKHGVTGIRW